MLRVCLSVEMEQDFTYMKTDLDNLYSWHINHLVGDGGRVRKIIFLLWNDLVAGCWFFLKKELLYY